MSTTATTPKATTNPDVAAGTAQFLTPVVIELEALVVNGKQAHWNLRGANFIGVHELLDTLVEHAQEWADTAAERIVALGLPIDARIATVAANTKAPALSDGFVQSDKSIAEVINQIDVALDTVNTAVRELDELDQSSQDVAIEIARGLDKDRWLLFAHIAK
ncbi:Dps family protein [Humibacter ginsenosidimutans]|uniref:DNA starvation/stationary phase protection protein n=1 Tax=Humibacter ginsenosidimutans TaxID=2599293 RepID=A0A5B8M245_9MICO|nr:DNA starvation/stationary phase protection protein [Humibacter ginsenosidimutans]QDZ14024.1 DNA starvation/stationary phase protection protein [Humibacter ginsenosidimutans]